MRRSPAPKRVFPTADSARPIAERATWEFRRRLCAEASPSGDEPGPSDAVPPEMLDRIERASLRVAATAKDLEVVDVLGVVGQSETQVLRLARRVLAMADSGETADAAPPPRERRIPVRRIGPRRPAPGEGLEEMFRRLDASTA